MSDEYTPTYVMRESSYRWHEWHSVTMFFEGGKMTQIEIMPGVLIQTGKDPDHINLIYLKRGSYRDPYAGEEHILLDLPIYELVAAIQEVQKGYDAPSDKAIRFARSYEGFRKP